jgi:hypothetical protein
MSKLLFFPVRALSGLVAGFIGKRTFRGLWSLLDKQEPPDPKQRDVSWGKVIAALLLQGAVFSAARGIVDRASRKGFSRLTGSWPGESDPPSA